VSVSVRSNDNPSLLLLLPLVMPLVMPLDEDEGEVEGESGGDLFWFNKDGGNELLLVLQ